MDDRSDVEVTQARRRAIGAVYTLVASVRHLLTNRARTVPQWRRTRMDRRRFLVGSVGAAILASRPADAFAQARVPSSAGAWDSGRLRHLLPTVSDTRMLIKASFTAPLEAPPTLRVGSATVRGRMTDTAGECWQFYAAGLAPARRHALSLVAANGASLCEPWELSTFPSRDATPDRFRVLFFT